VATSTQPCEGQGQAPSAKPWEPGSTAGHTIKSQLVFATLPGNGSAPMSDRVALYRYCAGSALPPAV
jgi:hypothetical protein